LLRWPEALKIENVRLVYPVFLNGRTEETGGG
jgi:hypothetical protein